MEKNSIFKNKFNKIIKMGYEMIAKLSLKSKYYFGQNCVKQNLENEIKNLKPKCAMLIYGGGSIKRNGVYETVISEIRNAKVKFIEHSGVQPNPTDEDTYKATLLGRKNKVDLIIAVGGGSVIDEAKVVSNLVTNTQYKNAWSYLENDGKATKPAVPVFSIITIAATGSENNFGSVITNTKTHDKWGVYNQNCPVVCFEDPTYTFSVSKWQTGSGCFDIMSHLLEQYYDLNKHFEWTKQYIIANMKVLLKFAPIALRQPNDYEARSNILWTSSWSLNNLAEFNTSGGDWKVHGLEHALSGRWNVSHGAGLALITPTYIEYMCKKNKEFKKLTVELGYALFGKKSDKYFITKLKAFIKTLGMPKKFTDFKEIKEVTKEDLKWLFEAFDRNTPDNHQLGVDIYSLLYKLESKKAKK